MGEGDHAVTARAEAQPPDVESPAWTGTVRTGEIPLVLRRGWDDFKAAPVPGLLVGAACSALGLLIVLAAVRHALVPLIVPLVGAFALIGPFAAVGQYRLSRRREAGLATRWWQTPMLFAGPRSGAIFGLGMVLATLMFAWIATAAALTNLMLPMPQDADAVAKAVVATPAGRRLMLVGGAVGFGFAAVVFAVSVVAFPLIVDRDVDMVTAATTSCGAVLANPLPMALWALVVAVGVVLAAAPALLGFIVVQPVLGHATWHLYRKVVPT